MTRYFLLIVAFSLGTSLSISAQTEKSVEQKEVYELFDPLISKPEFPGGENAMFNFIAKTLSYPAVARSKSIQGTVVLEFIIDELGNPTNIKAIRELGGGCTEESIRTVAAMPAWKPGAYQGKPVKVRYLLPLKFKFS